MYTVLYVDDEPGLLEIGKLFLEDNGQFSVDVITSAPEALARMNAKTYDAIISDYQMAGMDGIEFLKKVRTSGNTIPFILFTGRGREEIVIQALNEGADFYLQKGGDPTSQFIELSNKIQYAITRRRAEESLKQNEAQFRQIIDLVPHMIFANDRDGNFILVNQAVAQSYKKTVAEVEGKTQALFQRVPEELDRMLADNREVLATGKTRFIPEETYTDRFGKKRYLQTTKVPFTTLGNNQQAVLGVAVDITERKRAEQALLEREAQLNNSMDLANLVTWEVDHQTKMLTFNDRFYALYGTNAAREGGYTMPAEVYVREFVHPDDVDRVLEEAQKTTTTRDPHYKAQFEHRIIRRDGAIRHIIVLSEKIIGDDGITTKIHGVNQDITKRKEAEESLIVSEEKYRLLTEKASEIIIIAQDERIVYANPRFSEVLRVPQEEVIGKLFMDFVWPQDRELVRTRYQMRISGETDIEKYDFRFLDREGKDLWASISAVRILWNGKPATLSMIADISERKRAEEALRESEEKYRLVVEHSKDAIYIHQYDRLLFVNTRASVLTGYSHEELLQIRLWDLVHPGDRDKLFGNNRKRLAGGEVPTEFIARLLTKDGTSRICEFVVDLVTYRGAPAILGIARDITEHRQTEEALASANMKLKLLSGISRHDIRNQLTILEGHLAFIKKTRPDPPFRDHFDKMSAAARHIASIIQFTKEYEDIGIHAPLWQDCRTLADTAAKQVSPGQITVKNDLPPGMEVFADPLIAKVFFNLIDNAVRYGGKITTIRFSFEGADESFRIVCEDDGDGIPAEDKENIFRQGFGRNTGLGLFLSAAILNITGITIRETGEPGKGARFEMVVPKEAHRFVGGS